MKRKILIVDDDIVLCENIAYALDKEDFDVSCVYSTKEADKILKTKLIDLIILDRMMKDESGLDFLKRLRNQNNNTPVLMLTALSDADNVIEGLSSGANDYLGKPFKVKELVLRLNNILKYTRNKKIMLPKNLFFENDIFLYLDNDKKKCLNLSNAEYELLKELLTPMGESIVANAMIVKRLRFKLNKVLSNINIITVRNKGYKLIEVK